MSELDLSYGGRLTVAQSKKLTDLESVVRAEYTEFVGDLTTINKISGVSWLLGVTCRDPFGSRVLELLLRLALLEYYLRIDEPPSEVHVQNDGLGVVAKNMCAAYKQPVKIVYTVKENKSNFLLRLIDSVYNLFNQYLWPRVIRGKSQPNNSIILIEGVLTLASFNKNGEYKDGYFPGLLEGVDQKKRRSVWYLILRTIGLRSPKEHIEFWRKIRNSRTRFIIKEDYLILGDYLWAFIKSYTLVKGIKKIPRWRKYDVSSLLYDELSKALGNRTLIEALMCYRVFHRLRAAGITIDGVVDWHENQVIDRALCLGVRKNYPNCLIKGYQGYVVPEYYVHHDVSSFEKKANTVPDEICVVSPLLFQQKKQYCEQQLVTPSPALRFTVIDTEGFEQKNEARNMILLALPIHANISRQILKIGSQMNIGPNDRFLVKRHPHMDKAKLANLLEETMMDHDKVVNTEESLRELYHRTKLTISTGSSVCIESITAGVPVAIAGNLSGPPMNPLAGRISNRYWKICYFAEEVEELLVEAPGSIDVQHSDVFYPIDVGNVRQLLDFKVGFNG